MFRELPVDAQTVERVAKVLQVEARSLYHDEMLVAQHVEPSPESAKNVQSNGNNRKAMLVGFFTIGLVSLIALFFMLSSKTIEPDDCARPLSTAALTNNHQHFTLLIARFTDDSNNQAQLRLASQLASNAKFSKHVQIYTSCFLSSYHQSESINRQIDNAHQQARQELSHQRADIIVWGERYNDRLSLRFTSSNSQQKVHNLSFMGKSVVSSERDLMMNVRLDNSEAITSDLPLILLNLLSAENKTLKRLKKRLLDEFQYSGHWLKEAVVSDSQLLQRISPSSDPQLYLLTLTQLCYQRRLLGDIELSEHQYLQAKQACQQALNTVSKQEAPNQWAKLEANLAAINIRLHLYSADKGRQLALLEQAIASFKRVEQRLIDYASPAEFAVFYQNYAAAYIRLGEFTPNKMTDHFATALSLNQKSMDASKPELNPLYYAQRLQNHCVVKYRMGLAGKDKQVLSSAIADCRQAKALLDSDQQPHVYAMIQNNLAISHAILAELSNSAPLMEQALTMFNQAQTIYTKDRFVVNWAQVELNKAELTCKLALLSKDQVLLQSAMIHATNAQLVFVERGIGSYQKYVEQLTNKITLCQSDQIQNCTCSD